MLNVGTSKVGYSMDKDQTIFYDRSDREDLLKIHCEEKKKSIQRELDEEIKKNHGQLCLILK